MYEVAAVSVNAEVVVLEAPTLFGFVFGVELVVLPEFVGAVGKLASLLVGTVPVFHESLAELGLLLVHLDVH